MPNNAVVGGKVVCKRVGAGVGGWRRGRGPRARRGSGSDDASDEEYVVGGDHGEEGESSYDSYSSDASREASLEAEDDGCSEEEESDEEEEYDEEMEEAARGGRPGKVVAGWARRRRTVPTARRNSLLPIVLEVGKDMETPRIRKPRSAPRRRPPIVAEEEEYDDADDEDFAPYEEDDDEEEEEELARAPARKTGGVKPGPLKRQRRRGRPRNPNATGKRKKAPVTTKKRRRTAPSSEDDDFVVKHRIPVEITNRKTKKKNNKMKSSISNGRKRRSWGSRSDPSESDSSDLDYTISVGGARGLRVGRPLGHLVRRPPPAGAQGEKGKGKDVVDLGKQICGICLSEERKGVIRGLLDCCIHHFCFACIMEWSKVESRCPLCKRRFNTVTRSARSDAGLSLRTAVVRIPQRDQVYQPSEEEIRAYLDPYANVVCIECQQGGDDNLMLLCDVCDSPAHTYCVGLGRVVPEGNWYCDGCRTMDLGSTNSQIWESVAENGVRSDLFQDNFHGEIYSVNASLCMPHEPPRQSATMPHQPPEGIGQGASNRYPSYLGDLETESRVSGFAASTVSGRRTIHQRMRTILPNNSIRWTPEGVFRNNVMQPSSIENDVFGFEVERHGETFFQQESLTTEIDGRSGSSFLRSRINMSPCTHNEGSSCHIVEAAKEFSQW